MDAIILLMEKDNWRVTIDWLGEGKGLDYRLNGGLVKATLQRKP